MSQISLRARAGRTPGSRESRRVRRQGLVPAVVYGKGTDPTSLSVDARDLYTVLHTDAGSNAIISLEIEDGATLTTMARVIERHPFRNEYRHIDFVTVDLSQKVTAEVTISFEGAPVGVREGGVFSPRRTSVQIEVLPTEIPSAIELDVSDVEIGGSLRIADLPELEGIEYLEDPTSVVMSVTVPMAEVEEVEAALTAEEFAELSEEELEALSEEERARLEELGEGEEAAEAEGDEEAEASE
ncbi:MAG: 50S ribosomal protein L25 [Actinomycetota bacterium]|nr:50S ribosomal protein L25 [Actinomycetota bacterium]